MNVYIYVVTRDYGFAPNPFYGICTLATCKPGIRKSAQIGDWVFGIGSKTTHENKIIYLMKVTEKITFDEYWAGENYQNKKPYMLGSLKKMYGDNIYHFDKVKEEWIQENSHHSNEDGAVNEHNLRKDTKSNNVLISNEFYYFGSSAIEIPLKYQADVYLSTRGYRKIEADNNISSFLVWVSENFKLGYNADPLLFTTFERYDGIS